MAVYKSSTVWTMSTEALVEHLASIDAPDSIYWDARILKKEGRKFQNLSWNHFPRPTKNAAGQWVFVAATV
jgi:hypothetical protein